MHYALCIIHCALFIEFMARLASMDMLKGFAIILVIAGHAVQYLISGHYYDKEVYRLIYSFHMPLFMAITGFFASGGGQ